MCHPSSPAHRGAPMLSNEIATLLKSSRKTIGLTQQAAASRADVGHRLWAEVERGERPNVSLETALRMLRAVGVAVQLTDPTGATSEIRPPTSAIARAARAAARRAT